MVTVDVVDSKIILAYRPAADGLLLPIDVAEVLAEGLCKAADFAERELALPNPEPGQTWQARVVSWEGCVGIRFDRITDKVPLTPEAARRMARAVREAGEQARHNVTLIVKCQRS